MFFLLNLYSAFTDNYPVGVFGLMGSCLFLLFIQNEKNKNSILFMIDKIMIAKIFLYL